MIGITSVTFRKKSAEAIISLCRKCGVDAIEWGGDIHVPPTDLDNAARIGALTRDAGIQVSAYGSYFRVGIDSRDTFHLILATAAALGAPLIRVWCGDMPSQATGEEAFQLLVDELKAISTMAGMCGITVASEFHNNTYNDSAESAVQLLEAVNSEFYKTYWQTITYDDRDLQYLSRLIESVVTVHVFAWNRRGKRYPLKKQTELWRRYMDICKGSNVNFTIEFVRRDSARQFAKDLAVLKEWIKGQ